MAVEGTLQEIQDWAAGYLSFIGAPQSQGNIEGLTAQVYQEGDYGSAYGGGATNPLNIESGSGFLQPATTQQGYAATYSFMQTNDPGFIAALRGNNSVSPEPYINALAAGQWEALNSGSQAYLNPQYAQDVSSVVGEIYGGSGGYTAPAITPTAPNAGTRSTTGLTGLTGSGTNGNANLSGGPGPQGFQGPGSGDYSPPVNQPGFATQTSAALTQVMQPPITVKNANTGESATGYLQDAIGLLTLGTAGRSPVQVIQNTFRTDAEAVSAISGDPVSNIWRTISSSLIRLGIGLAGLLLMAAGLWIIVNKVSGGATPVPVPV
jgi:hypothetical protein